MSMSMNPDYGKLSSEYGTPFYLFDFEKLKERIRFIRNSLGEEFRLCYAMKANPMLIGGIYGEIDSFEVCSPGEFRLTEKAGISRKDIVLSGVYKEEADIRRVAGTYGNKGIFTAESLSQLLLLQKTARECSLKLPVLLRLTAGNQFGMDADTIRKIVSSRKEYEELDLLGLQLYGGTQKKKPDRFRKEILLLDDLISELKESSGFETRLLEYGPGLGVNYFEKDALFSEEGLLKELSASLHAMRYRGQISLEMGRFIAAPCGVYVTKISDIKVNDGVKYCITDGGVNHLNYYGHTLAMQVPFHEQLTASGEKKTSGEKETAVICGALCTVADVLVRNMELCSPEEGDLLIFENTGAYSVTESMYLFLTRDLPAVLFKDGGGKISLHRSRRGTDGINA